MIRVGLTGGIGSGKSTVAMVFEELGIPVFYSDTEAKLLLLREDVKTKLHNLFGNTIFSENEINKAALANIIFNNAEALTKVNQLIHPMVRSVFENWCNNITDKNYCIIEAAILFENGFDALVDKSIVVIAPLNERIERVIKRDQSTTDGVLARINNQWPQEKIISLSDFQIDNSDQSLIIPQIIKINDRLNTINSLFLGN